MRHGERADQVDDEWYRSAPRPHDPPLTVRGKRQAAATSDALGAARIEVVYASPFLRCVQTAASIAQPRGLQIRIEPAIGEMLHEEWFDFSGYECVNPRSGMPVDAAMSTKALAAAFGEALIDTSYVPLMDAVERGAEPATELLAFPEEWHEGVARYERALEALRAKSPFCALVTHGAGVQACAESCNGVNMEDMEIDYCCVTELKRQGAWAWKVGGSLASSKHIDGI